jgi:hypothetical protein
MLGPRFPGLGGIEGNNKLAGGVNGVGGKAKGGRMQVMPGRKSWVGFPGSEGVERELIILVLKVVFRVKYSTLY